jgi:hypothetical protein
MQNAARTGIDVFEPPVRSWSFGEVLRRFRVHADLSRHEMLGLVRRSEKYVAPPEDLTERLSPLEPIG